MNEKVALDRAGTRALEMDDAGVTLRAPVPYVLTLGGPLSGKVLVSNERLEYERLRDAALVRKRDPWDLAMGIIFTVAGIVWSVRTFGRWLAFAVAAAWLLAFGIRPLTQYLRGKRFVVLATDDRAIAFPLLLRKRRQIGRFLKALRERVPSPGARWAV
jgi:hypothetical protein